MMTADEWGQAEKPLQGTTLAMLDDLAKKIKEARVEYEAKSKEKTAAHDALEKLEMDMINLLKVNNRQSYNAPGIGTVGYRIREQYTVPKNVIAKECLFKYIEDKYGKDTLMGMMSINSQTLNSWANKEVESGEVQQIPGLDQPTAQEIFSFRKD